MDLKILLDEQPRLLEAILDEQFSKMDFLKSGYITRSDIMREYSYIDSDDIEIIMSEFDKDGSGFIDKPSFKLIFKELIRKIY